MAAVSLLAVTPAGGKYWRMNHRRLFVGSASLEEPSIASRSSEPRPGIAYFRQLGLDAGLVKIFWMTQSDNHAAQHLCDKVAMRMDYLRYDLNVCDP